MNRRDRPAPVVAIFAKSPEPGKVKTRLTPALHSREAADLYRALLQDTLAAAEAFGGEAVVAFTPQAARRPLERLLGGHRTLIPQG
ncbi:MAG: glycosyltransferase, partial [Gemmatimonadota bacterium]|nr:glycosyltransferase [Gemmatimonadota bacterium]